MATETVPAADPAVSPSHDVSQDYEIPEPVSTSFTVLKERIRYHYERCSDFYQSMWYEGSLSGAILEITFPQGRAYPSWIFQVTFGH